LIALIQRKEFDNKELFDEIRKEFQYTLSLFHHREFTKKIKSYEDLNKKTSHLEHVNSLLEKIKDISAFDEEYYKNKYADLKTYEGGLIDHYVKYGNKEGRFPNAYVELNNIKIKGILPTSYRLSQQQEKLQTLQSKIEDLEEQKSQTEQNYQQKIEETQRLNQQMEELLEDLATLKESKEQLASELGDKLQKAEELNAAQKEELAQQQEQLQALQSKIEELEAVIKPKEKESEKLNKMIDTIVNDLASIKESKCWIYTKPLRDIQKIFKGDKDVQK
jgi:uncharacterized coiled-coil DUF342 family protein